MPPPRPSYQPRPDGIVAVGLLTQRDIEVLGTGFRRLFPIENTACFDDLLHQLNQLPRVPSPRD